MAGAHTMWMDNYSKNVKFSVPDIGQGWFHQGLWTGFALRACPEDISMSLLHDEADNLINAMPANPFDYRKIVQDGITNSMFDKGDKCHLRFRSSYRCKWKVNNVPLRPSVENLPATAHYAEHRRKLADHADSLDHLHPHRLLDINCGENAGFARCMKMLSFERNWGGEQPDKPACDKYTSMYMDCDLYDKCVKVCFSIVLLHLTSTQPICTQLTTDDVRPI